MSGALQTRVVAVSAQRPDSSRIAEAADILRGGGLVAFPTETVYGLGADATNPAAVTRIFKAKGRPSNNPLIVHVHCHDLAVECVAPWQWTEEANELAHEFWPGPLTLVLPRSSLIPDLVTAGMETVGIRMPRAPVALDLIRETGRPLAAPSANRSTKLSPTMAAHVLQDLDGRIEMILDAGPTEIGLESTVLDLTTREPHILRAGPITAGQIRHVLGGTRVHEADISHQNLALPAKSPGQMALHYAPKTPLHLIRAEKLADWSPDQGERVGLIVTGRPIDRLPQVEVCAVFSTPESAAHSLYATLHVWDKLALSAIYAVLPPGDESWAAVRDRLTRAMSAKE